MKLLVPDDLSLRPYQQEAIKKTIKWFSTGQHSIFNSMEVGLGKTITSLVTYNTIVCGGSMLVLAPRSMALIWEQEAYKWCGKVSIQVITSSKDKIVTQPNLLICTYDLVWRKDILAQLKKLKFDLLTADEVHKTKGDSKRAKAFYKEIWPLATYKLLLSGTPFTRCVTDCFNAFHACLPTFFPSFDTFAARYSKSREIPIRYVKYGRQCEFKKTVYEGLINGEELSKIIRSKFFIRYKKKDVLTDLPELVWSRVPLSEEYSIKNDDTVFSEASSVIQAITENKPVKIAPNLAHHRQAQGVAKVPAIVGFADDLLEQEVPLVIFCQHTEVILKVAQGLVTYSPRIIQGATTPKDRLDAINAFREGEYNVIILQIQAGGEGITLTRANNVIFAEMPWTPAETMQCAGRCHRIGTKGQVTAHYLVVKNSIDERIAQVVISRTKQFTELFG